MELAFVAAAAVDWRTTGHRFSITKDRSALATAWRAILFAENSNSAGLNRLQLRHAHEGAVPAGSGPPIGDGGAARQFRAPPAATGLEYLSAQRGVFVTLRERSGMLRGCAGTILPACANLVAETWRSARVAAFQDSRFSPVEADELPNLRLTRAYSSSMENFFGRRT